MLPARAPGACGMGIPIHGINSFNCRRVPQPSCAGFQDDIADHIAHHIADDGAFVAPRGSSYTVPTENIVHRKPSDSELESFPSLDWSDIAPRLTPDVRASLEKILETQNGADLSLEESYALANAEGDDLLGLLAAANLLRAELAGNIVTYVVNRNINFTNICFVGMQILRLQPWPA